MSVGVKVRWAGAILVLAAAATPAVAQVTGGGPDARVSGSAVVTLSPEEQLKTGEGLLGKIGAGRAEVRRMLETSRAQRDVVKTLCLNDKLNQLDVTGRTADERFQTLKSAAARKDSDAAGHEFTMLRVLEQRGDQLTSEARLCVGEQEAFLSSSRVTETLDPNLAPAAKETEFPSTDPTLVTEVPKCTSCVR